MLPFVEEQLKSIFRPKFALVSCPKLSQSIVGDSQKRLDVLKLNYSLRKSMFSRDAAKKLISIVLYISEPAARAVRELKKGGPETQREEMSVSFGQ